MSAEKRKRRYKRRAKRAARELRSPFDLTANLYAYVPREAMESCLRFTVRALRRGESRIVVTGPAGIGKTLLLHMIGDRIGHELGFVYLPYAALPPEDLCTWALGRMKLPSGNDPIEALTQHARELGTNNKALLLLLDDASTMSLSTARWLSDLVTELEGALRLVVAVTDGPQVEPLLEALGPEIEPCRLDQPLSLKETRAYVTSRLELAMAPESTHSRFDDATIDAIHRASEGNPRQLHQVASAVLRGVVPESVEFESIVFERERELPAPSAEAVERQTAPAQKKKPKPRRQRKGAARKERGEAEVTASAAVPRAIEPSVAVLYEAEPSDLASSSAADVLPQAPPPKLQETNPQPPRRAPLTPLAPMRVFRSVGIIAAALVAMVLARPVVHLNPPVVKVVTAPQAITAIPTALPQLPPGIITPQPAAKPAPPAASGIHVGPLSVQVNATPWARIEVDGVNLGATPVANIPLLPGEHTFRARMSDGRTLEKVVDIDESRRFVSFE